MLHAEQYTHTFSNSLNTSAALRPSYSLVTSLGVAGGLSPPDNKVGESSCDATAIVVHYLEYFSCKQKLVHYIKLLAGD